MRPGAALLPRLPRLPSLRFFPRLSWPASVPAIPAKVIYLPLFPRAAFLCPALMLAIRFVGECPTTLPPFSLMCQCGAL